MEGNRRVLLGKWLLILSGVVSLVLALWFYPRVFPIPGLRLQLSRAEAAERATRFLQQMEVQIPPSYTRATRFAINSAAKSYLEQQLGIARANQVAQTEGFVYFWHTRWFRPGSERELFVAIDPEGRVLSFSDRLPTDARAPPSRQPRRVAERFISEVVGVDLRAYRLLGEYQASHPNRVDYSYVWERTDLRLAEATQRIGVTVTGDRVIYFMRYLHFPERFTHTFRWHRSRGDLLVVRAACWRDTLRRVCWADLSPASTEEGGAAAVTPLLVRRGDGGEIGQGKGLGERLPPQRARFPPNRPDAHIRLTRRFALQKILV